MVVKSRIQLKNDTEANWDKALRFTPKEGEVIIYSTDDSHPFSRLKVGDGRTTVVNLPFIDAGTLNGKIIEANTTAYWNQKIDYIPTRGSIIIYLDKNTRQINNETINVPAIKIGDGSAYLIDLPFMGDSDTQDFINHMADTIVHISEEERIFWNNKINVDDAEEQITGELEEETLILNRN